MSWSTVLRVGICYPAENKVPWGCVQEWLNRREQFSRQHVGFSFRKRLTPFKLNLQSVWKLIISWIHTHHVYTCIFIYTCIYMHAYKHSRLKWLNNKSEQRLKSVKGALRYCIGDMNTWKLLLNLSSGCTFQILHPWTMWVCLLQIQKVHSQKVGISSKHDRCN